ncbi:MAG: cytochrome-c peroxidase [Marinovum sp.]|nr:cytochrome-c peroxidase [Marinovum sp.]
MIRPIDIILAMALLTNGVMANPLPEANATYAPVDMAQVRLGQLLFYDPILSGSKTVACATCHHPKHATADGLSLGLGDGAHGLGPKRMIDPKNLPEQRVPRNAPALFNLGAHEFTTMFHDGRLEADPTRPSGIRTPLGTEMVQGFASVLSAQSMFPVLSPDEMAGHYTESDVARAVRQGFLTGEDGAWSLISARVADIKEYQSAFEQINGPGHSVTFTDISDVIAEFIAFEWRADDSPFDQYLRTGEPLPKAANLGMSLFYGKAQCSTCHAGQFQTDHDFHAIALPQVGPGKSARFETHARDEGRLRVTGNPADAYKFRTPSLRNIAQTAPYGHNGAYATLEAMIRHHLDPVASLKAYNVAQLVLPDLPNSQDFRATLDPDEQAAIAAANELSPSNLSETEIIQIVAFLNALSDTASLAGKLGVPQTVPSGLSVDQ